MIEFLSVVAPFIVAFFALLTAYLEWRKSKQEAQNFRQNLIFLLHHAEGISTSLRTIANGKFSTVDDVKQAVSSAQWNSESLFFGLIESKVGGVSLKNDLDKKYSDWADTELERKIRMMKNWLENNLPVKTNDIVEKLPVPPNKK